MSRTRKNSTLSPDIDLKDACVDAARESIAAHGVEQLSLRDVARRLGVSHQAPYRHYPSRDHLLAEVMRRCFRNFTVFLEARESNEDPQKELEALGRQYLRFALAHPLEYRLMFNTPWPQSAEHPELVRDATHAFDTLRNALARIHNVALPNDLVNQNALFIWSTMHGLASLMGGNCMHHLNIAEKTVQDVPEHILAMIGLAMQGQWVMNSDNAAAPTTMHRR